MRKEIKPHLKVTLIQPDIIWQDTQANIALIDSLMAGLHSTDLIILPEMWNTGFSMTPEVLATTMEGIVVKQMQKWASHKSAIVGGSVIIEENGKYYNRFLLISNTGPIASYDKKHLFTLAGEQKVYTGGDRRVTCSDSGWEINLNVCYDLRFPVWSRNTTGFDLLIYVANWPAARHHAWRTLLQARAIENQCYVIGSNRVGSDANENHYLGGSAVINYLGEHLLEMDDQEGVGSIHIDKESLLSFRSKMNFLGDKDAFSIL